MRPNELAPELCTRLTQCSILAQGHMEKIVVEGLSNVSLFFKFILVKRLWLVQSVSVMQKMSFFVGGSDATLQSRRLLPTTWRFMVLIALSITLLLSPLSPLSRFK